MMVIDIDVIVDNYVDKLWITGIIKMLKNRTFDNTRL